MIVGFRHKGLKLLFERGDRRRVLSHHVEKIERILARLDEASEVGNLDLPGFRLHPLRGEFAGFWSVAVSGNWCIIFRFEGGNASGVDLIDYQQAAHDLAQAMRHADRIKVERLTRAA